ASAVDDQTERMLGGGQGDEGRQPPDEAPDIPGETRGGHSDLVAEIIRETGLLPDERVETVRRSATRSGCDALIDEGVASALGVARRLAEQYQLPLVDLAVAGVD